MVLRKTLYKVKFGEMLPKKRLKYKKMTTKIRKKPKLYPWVKLYFNEEIKNDMSVIFGDIPRITWKSRTTVEFTNDEYSKNDFSVPNLSDRET